MKPKKSETLEIRLSHTLKQAFVQRCSADGATASETVRQLIQSYLARRPARRFKVWVRVLAAAGGAISVAAVAAPSLARPSPLVVFKSMDVNHAGRLSFEAFAHVASVRASLVLGDAKPLAIGFLADREIEPATARRSGGADMDLNQMILRQAFDQIDTNHDGEISFEEFRRYYGQ